MEIFCGNFSSRRGSFNACYSAWCARCYQDDGEVKFPRVIPMDEEGVAMPCKEDSLFLSARAGDTLMTPFQCELCHFRNIKKRNPEMKNDRDRRALLMCRRANLDAFWARTAATVSSNLSDLRQLVKHSSGLWGVVPSLPARGPFPLADSFGMSVASATLARSLDPGRNSTHIQFNTARRIRSAYSNAWNASIHTLEIGVMQAGQSKLMVTDCPVYHYWYTRMMKGMHERMGDLVVQDQAISRELQIEIMKELEKKLIYDRVNKDRWIEIGTYVMMLWLGSLRGNEAMMADLGGCAQLMKESEIAQSDFEYGVLVLRGKFKTSTGYTKYLLYLSSDTKSPFRTPFRGWMVRLLEVRLRQGRTTGWLFSKEDGSPLEMTHYEVDILRIIADIQESSVGIIPKDMDVFDRYGVFRSWRRGSSSIARNEGVRKEDIDLNNGWRKEENSRGKHVSSDMLAYYTEDLLVLKSKLRFSKAL